MSDTGNLVKNSFTIVGKNREILKPTFAQIKIAVTMYVFFVLSVLSFFVLPRFGAGLLWVPILILVLTGVYLIVIFPFVKIYYQAAQAWLVYKTFGGKQVVYADGISRARENKWDIFVIGLLGIVFSLIAGKLRNGAQRAGFLLGAVLALAGAAVEEGWDLIGNFLLPASIIQEKSVAQTVPELKTIKNNIPGALAGVFGVDFVGGMAVSSIFWILALLTVVIGGGCAWLLGVWSVLVVMIILDFGILIIAGIFVDMVKTVYFSLFYISVSMPSEISKSYRAEVTNYLLKK